jgi:hypothetical protein
MLLLPINHTHQLQITAASPQQNHVFPYTNSHFCDVYCLVPNIRYRPNIRQHFLAEYSFSAETRKSVFGRSLQSTNNKILLKLCYTFGETLPGTYSMLFMSSLENGVQGAI